MEKNNKRFTFTLKQRIVLSLIDSYLQEENIDIDYFKHPSCLQSKAFVKIKGSIYRFMNGYAIHEALSNSQFDKHDINKIVGISKDYISMIAQQYHVMLRDNVDIASILSTLPKRLQIKQHIKNGESDKEIAATFDVSKQYIHTLRLAFETSLMTEVIEAVEKGLNNAQIQETYQVREEFIERVRMIPMIRDSYRRMNPYDHHNIERLKSLYPSVNTKFLECIL